MSDHVTVEEWVEMFRDIGLQEEAMKQWHRVFESRHPRGHLSFLKWLGLSTEEIERIRSNSR
jgi:hypothetical protein